MSFVIEGASWNGSEHRLIHECDETHKAFVTIKAEDE